MRPSRTFHVLGMETTATQATVKRSQRLSQHYLNNERRLISFKLFHPHNLAKFASKVSKNSTSAGNEIVVDQDNRPWLDSQFRKSNISVQQYNKMHVFYLTRYLLARQWLHDLHNSTHATSSLRSRRWSKIELEIEERMRKARKGVSFLACAPLTRVFPSLRVPL